MLLLSKLTMNKSLKTFVCIILFLVFFFLLVLYKNKSREKRQVYAYAIISNFYPSYRTPPIVKASFFYKGVKYECSGQLSGLKCSLNNFAEKTINKELVVVFDSTNPNNNLLLISRETYKKVGFDYPLFLDDLKQCFD